MGSFRYLMAILALAAVSGPVLGSIVIYTGSSAQVNFQNATTGLFFPDPLASFTSSDLTDGNKEYADPNTLVDFFGFNGASADQLSVTATELEQTVGGGLIEISLPSNVEAFAAQITVPSSAGTFCIDPASTFNTGSNCDATVTVTSSSDTEFIGVVSTTPISTIWLGPLGGSPTLAMKDFEVGETGTAAPDVPPFLLIGTGLIGLRFVGRFRRRRV